MLTAPRFLMSGDRTETGAGAVELSSRRFCWGMERSRRLPGAILKAFVAKGSGEGCSLRMNSDAGPER